MSVNKSDFSTQQISPQLVSQIVDALRGKAFGSVEIYVENYSVTQITERTINKVSKSLKTASFAPVKTAEKSQISAS